MENNQRPSGGKMSLADIQAEQEQERRHNANSINVNHQQQGRRSSGPRSSYNGGGFHSRTGSGGRRGSHHRRGSDRSSLPLERGCICSMKEKFGFIHCADRPLEIFFHYSEVSNVHPDHLQLDDEVEFRVGKSRDNPEKLAALEVIQLPPGTIEWEYEESPGERFQGLIDRPLLRSSSNNGMMRRNSENDNINTEGLIRLLVPASEGATKSSKGESSQVMVGANGNSDNNNSKDGAPDTAALDTMAASGGPKIRFTVNDYNPDIGSGGGDSGPEEAETLSRKNSSSSNGGRRLYRGDLVEFTLVVEKRTRQKFARNIVLLQSERERACLAKEEELLASAALERGVVVSLKQDFGFLRSNARRDEVYFHYSHVQLPEVGKNGDDGEANKENDGEDYELQIGQEMEFLVVTEEIEDRNSNSGNGRKLKTSARKVKFLPKGSVEFSRVIAEGVTGKVTIVPRADAGRNAQKERDPQCLGCIRLTETISTRDPTCKVKAKQVSVGTILLHVGDAPGGLFSCSRGSAMGLWVREGDTLLFDVTYDFVDKAYYATPTKHLVPVGSPLVAGGASPTGADRKDNPVNNNGVEEGGDAAADKEETIPSGGNNKNKMSKQQKQNANANGAAVRLIGLSLAGRAEGTVHTMKEAYGFIHFAERPVDIHFKQFELLPDNVQEDLRRNMSLLMTPNTKAEMMGFHKLSNGTEAQFDLSVQGTVMTQNQHQHRGGNKRGAQPNQHERENLKAQRILILPMGTILQNKTIGLGIRGVIAKEDPNQPYAGILDLEEEFMQMVWSERHPLVVKMVDEFLQDTAADSLVFHDIQSPKEEDVIEEILELKAKGKFELTHIPHAGDSRYLGRLCIRKVSAGGKTDSLTTATTLPESNEEKVVVTTEAAEAKDEKKQEEEKEEAMPKCKGGRSKSPKGGRSKSPKARANKKKKALQQKLQPVKTIRYDKSSLTQNAKADVPPGAGDVVICDVHQNRRTGKVYLENLIVAERKVMGAEEAATLEGATGVGVVKEVVLASKFGFISVSDESATKRELLFFHFDSVVNQNRHNQHNHHGRNRKGGGQLVINKGDEVKFRIGTEKNGKRVAIDVQVVSSGTIPNKVDRNACRGYVLVEPTDTKVGSPIKHSRSFTRSRDAPAPPKPGGRWANAREEDHHKDKLSEKGEGVILLLEDPTGMFASVLQSVVDTKKERDDQADPDQADKLSNSNVLGKCHLHYQNGALALHGAGAPTTMDSSTNPRRGDLVSFVKSKNSASGVKDIRVVTRAVATLVRGQLESIDHLQRKAKFVCNVGDAKKGYDIDLKEVVSCDPSQLKNRVEVEGILHEDAVHGICRTTDLRLESKLGTGRKERPKLNLTVKKDRAGTIMAQSMMAKGPDGTTGFKSGWTIRVSQYTQADALLS